MLNTDKICNNEYKYNNELYKYNNKYNIIVKYLTI